jgi:hypothetical protein
MSVSYRNNGEDVITAKLKTTSDRVAIASAHTHQTTGPQMKRAILAAVLILASSVAFADATSVLLDADKVSKMSAEEYAAAVKSAPDVNVRGKFGQTPLHYAAKKGTPANIVALLEAGASGGVKDKKGKTPFDYARGNDKVEGTAAYWALNDAQYK